MVTTDSVLSVRVAVDTSIPSFSEMKILATTRGQLQVFDMSYLLEGQLQDSDLMIAKALVTPGDLILV